MSALVVERERDVLLPAGSTCDDAALMRTRHDEAWLAVVVAAAPQRHPHYAAAKRFLDALREGRDSAEGLMAEFASLRPDILRGRAIFFSTFPNKHDAVARFVRVAKDEACRITDCCDECLRSPVACACERIECARCGGKFRRQDIRSHACGAPS